MILIINLWFHKNFTKKFLLFILFLSKIIFMVYVVVNYIRVNNRRNMQIYKTYKFRLYPTEKQQEKLNSFLGLTSGKAHIPGTQHFFLSRQSH